MSYKRGDGMSGNYVVKYILVDFDCFRLSEHMEQSFDTFVEAEKTAKCISADACYDHYAEIYRADRPDLLPAKYAYGERLLEVTE